MYLEEERQLKGEEEKTNIDKDMCVWRMEGAVSSRVIERGEAPLLKDSEGQESEN